MKNIWLVLLVSFGFICAGQAQLNNYQYVVVPKMLQDFNEENKYNSSTLIKYLLTENGFESYYEGDVPRDIIDRCKGLRIDLLDESTLFRTKAVLVLKDCHGSEVFRTMQGESRSKSFKEGYGEAITEAFQSIKALNYKYEPSQTSGEAVTVNFDGDVKSMDKTPEPVVERVNKSTNPAVVQKSSPEEQSYESKVPKPSNITKKEPSPSSPVPADAVNKANATEVWYAQKLPNGYQLVDSSPKIRLILRESSLPGVYFGENEAAQGLVFQKDGHWYFEFYKGDEKVVQTLNLKF